MNMIARSLLCSLALAATVAGSLSAQTSGGSSGLPRHAQLTVQRPLRQGGDARFRYEWGNAVIRGAGGRQTPVYLSRVPGTSPDAHYVMYGEPFIVPEGGGTLSFFSNVGVQMPAVSGRSKGLAATSGAAVVLQQGIELIDAGSGERLRGINHTFLMITPQSNPADTARSYDLQVDLAQFAGRRVRLRALLIASSGSAPCPRCPDGPLPVYWVSYTDAPASVTPATTGDRGGSLLK